MGSQNCVGNERPETILQEAIAGGITAFQFREKGSRALVGEDKISLGKKLRTICREHNIPFIINDDVDLADILKPDGIHVGQDDMPVEKLREKFPHIIIGLSISNEDELAVSNLEVIDYVGAGPVYRTSTKEDAKKAVGLQWITELRRRHPDLPIVGIGGIDESNAADVIAAGANGVSVISAITKSKNIPQTVRSL